MKLQVKYQKLIRQSGNSSNINEVYERPTEQT